MKTSKTIKGLLVGAVLAANVLVVSPFSTSALAATHTVVSKDGSTHTVVSGGQTSAVKDFKTYEDLKKIAIDLYNSPEFAPKEVVVYTKTDLAKQLKDYLYLSNDISQDIAGYAFYGRGVEIESQKKGNDLYQNTVYIVNDRTYKEEIDWKKKMDLSEKYIVSNYKLETDYDVVYAVNDFVINQIEYGKAISDDHPFLVERMNASTCTGYTDVVAELLKRFGLNSRLVSGDVHAWNAVEVGGKWYYTDATFTDKKTKDSKFILFTQSVRDEFITRYDTKFKATNVKFEQSMAKPYDYKEVKKAQASKK